MITKEDIHTAQSLAPLLSEGSISPFQVSDMSNRQKKQRQININKRYDLEYKFKRQNMTTEELNKEKSEKEQDKIKSRIRQINSYLNMIKDCPQLKSKRENGLKLGQRLHLEELEKLQGGLKE